MEAIYINKAWSVREERRKGQAVTTDIFRFINPTDVITSPYFWGLAHINHGSELYINYFWMKLDRHDKKKTPET